MATTPCHGDSCHLCEAIERLKKISFQPPQGVDPKFVGGAAPPPAPKPQFVFASPKNRSWTVDFLADYSRIGWEPLFATKFPPRKLTDEYPLPWRVRRMSDHHGGWDYVGDEAIGTRGRVLREAMDREVAEAVVRAAEAVAAGPKPTPSTAREWSDEVVRLKTKLEKAKRSYGETMMREKTAEMSKCPATGRRHDWICQEYEINTPEYDVRETKGRFFCRCGAKADIVLPR